MVTRPADRAILNVFTRVRKPSCCCCCYHIFLVGYAVTIHCTYCFDEQYRRVDIKRAANCCESRHTNRKYPHYCSLSLSLSVCPLSFLCHRKFPPHRYTSLGFDISKGELSREYEIRLVIVHRPTAFAINGFTS